MDDPNGVLRRISRRAVLGFIASVGAADSCSRSNDRTVPVGRKAAAQTPTDAGPKLLLWDLGTEAWGRAAAAIIVPPVARGTKLPLLVALHGRGESMKSAERGALGWPDDYALVRAIERISSPPLTARDLEELAPPGYVTSLNAQLEARPYEGLVVLCPYLPDLDSRNREHIGLYERFLTSVAIPRARADCPVMNEAASTGIDGVSHGGAFALKIGLRNPTAFGSVGAIQPAIREADTPELTELAVSAKRENSRLALRLATSDGDYFRESVLSLSRAWEAAGIKHRYLCAPGPHDYVFNRGPGAYELLTWNSQVLAR